MHTGQKLGTKYQVIEKVGQGGMAVVYRGRDTSLQREVAIKVLHSHLAEHQEARERFSREAHAVAKLRHKNILEIYDFSGLDSEDTFIVTEFIDGCTLQEFVADHAIHFAELGALIVAQVCGALAHAHKLGVLHRDVKPENIMIRNDGVVKLTDFGIAQMVDLHRMTLTGQLMGSPAFMSPEHVEGGVLDFRTDVFALGIVLYQLVTGRLPFDGKNPHEILKKIADCQFTDPARVSPRVGKELGGIIATALKKNPEERYRNISLMQEALESYLAGSGLADGQEELRRFFATPAPYQMALEERLVEHLSERAKTLLAEHRNQAIELLNRVLTIDEDNTEVLALLAQGEARQRRMRIAVFLVAAAALGGLAIIAKQRFAAPEPGEKGGTRPRVSVAAIADPTAATAATAATLSASRFADASPPGASSTSDTPPGLALASLRDATPTASGPATSRPTSHGTRRRPPHNRRANASLSPPAKAARQVSLRITPTTSEYRVDEGPWTHSPGGRVRLTLDPGPHLIAARNSSCCQEMERKLHAGSDNSALTINLRYLPGQVTPVCDRAGIRVSLNGTNVPLGRAHTVAIRRLVGTEVVTLEFFSDARVDSHQITVAATSQQEVRCRF